MSLGNNGLLHAAYGGTLAVAPWGMALERDTLDEEDRQRILSRYAILDTPPEEALDDLAAMAAATCRTSSAVIALMDEKRVWFKSRLGVDVQEMPLEGSFCSHLLDHPSGLFIVSDASNDPRFATNRHLSGEGKFRFYAGAPLASPEGAVIGSLCVMDREPRTLTADQEEALSILARQVMSQLELRRRSRDLQNSEQKLRAIFAAEPACVKLLGADAQLMEINAAGLRVIEADDASQLLGQSLMPIVAPEDREAVRAVLESVVRGEMHTTQFRIIGLKGTARWLEMSAVPFHSEETGQNLVLGVSHDITASKVADEKVRRLNRLYAVSSAINQAIVRMNKTQELYEQACRIAVELGGLTMAWVGLVDAGNNLLQPAAIWGRNEGYLDTIRIPLGELGRGPASAAIRTGAPACCTDIAAPEAVFGSKSEALQRGYRTCAAFPLKAKGKYIGALVVYGDQPGYFDTEELQLLNALAENISFAVESQERERRRLEAESALRDSEQRYRDIVELSPDAIILYRNGLAEYVNPAGLKLLRATEAGQVIGRTPLDLFLPGGSRHRHRAAPPSSGQAGHRAAGRKRKFAPLDGTMLDVETAAVSFKDRGDVVIQSVCRDVTERRKLEQQFLRAQRMESVGTLAGGIAHDLNNVLGPIITAIELLKIRFTDADSQEVIDIIGSSAQRGADMVRQVLSFARGIEGKRMELKVHHLVREIEKIANDTFLKNIRIRTSLPPDLWPVVGDPTQLHQVLLNLCVNARDAMPHGGTLSITGENIVLDTHYAGLNLEAKTGPYVVLQVEDTGTGMPPNVIDLIFDPFFTTKDIGKGTGLGLSTSLAIVKSHGGFIRVYSEEGKGTKLKVYIPAQTAGGDTPAAEPEAEMPRGDGELILVIDDEDSVRRITQQTLEAFGYHALIANDGTEAIVLYARRYDEIRAVVTDLMMPNMDGAATIQILKRINPSVRIVAASGASANNQFAHVASLGVKYFLPKPYTAEALLKILKRVLEE